MTDPEPTPSAQARLPLSAAVLLAALLAVGVGLLAPLLLGDFSNRQALVLAIVEAACLAAIAIGIVILMRRLRASHEALWSLARRDELTGVGNYRALHERLTSEIARHQRHRREFALLLIDLNGFKAVNERFGHLEGDRLLAEIGAALREEFAMIVPETGAEGAAEVAARLRRRVAERGFGSDESRPITAATGFAMYPADGTTVEDLMGFADLDLFATKREGRPAQR